MRQRWLPLNMVAYVAPLFRLDSTSLRSAICPESICPPVSLCCLTRVILLPSPYSTADMR